MRGRKSLFEQQIVYSNRLKKLLTVLVECIERGLDPLTTNLVVADNSRTEKTICSGGNSFLKIIWCFRTTRIVRGSAASARDKCE